ncbi:MAG: hypothetical protein J6S41_05200 [Clostridia bacterium]|nr:hypothetical protein [Clostridia bacterium]
MKLDRNTVRSFSEMSDDRLWRTLRMLAGGMGMELPERQRARLHYEAIRRTLREITDADIDRINEILERYKQHKNNWRGGGYR